MRHAIVIGCLGAVLFASAEPGRAEVNPDAKLLLHLVPAPEGTVPGCYRHHFTGPEGAVTAGEVGKRYFAYVMIADVDPEEGIAGVQFGVHYDGEEGSGVDIDSWQECSLYQWHLEDWPSSDTGNLLTWSQVDDCQRTVPVVVGYFTLYVHSPDRFQIIPRPVDGLAQVAACGIKGTNADEKLDVVRSENLGWVEFGGGKGYNPWDPKQNLLKIQERLKRDANR